jgi:hypothetical protein
MNINVNALKEAFYKQLYNDYMSFLKIHIKKDGTDVFSKTLKDYHGFDVDWDLGEIRNDYTIKEIRICASIEDFFNIIGSNSNALEYVSFLMQYIKNATTKVEGSWLMVEDSINKLILKHYWEQRCIEGSLTEDGVLTITTKDKDGKTIPVDLSLNDFIKDSSFIKEHQIIDLMGKLPPVGLNSIEQDIYRNHDKKFFTKHLHASRIVRNKFGHKEKLLPDNFADAVILARFKLYSYLAATLCLGTKEPQIDTQLIIEDQSEGHDAKFKVFEVKITKENGTDERKYEILSEVLDFKRTSLGCEYQLKRCHIYLVEVLDMRQELNLKWFSLNPIGTWDGIKLTLYDNDFEKVAHDPSGTMSSIHKMNEQISETLTRIDKTLCDGTKEQKKQMNQVLEELKNLQQNNYKSTQAKYEALLEANKEQSKQLEEINTTLGKQTTILAEMAASIGENKNHNQEIASAIKLLTENLAQIRETVSLYLNSILGEQEQKRRNEKKWFIVKRLPIWLALCAAAIGCFFHCTRLQTIYWMTLKPFYIVSLILGPILLVLWLLWIYRSTKRKELITHRIKIADWSAIALSTILWGTAIVATPHPTEEEYIQNFGWTSSDNICQKFILYVEKYLKENPESEVARIKLAEYYLDIANDMDSALVITNPMTDVKKYPTGCVYAAEAFYRSENYIRVKEIIDDYNQLYPGNSRLGLDRLYALLLINGKIYNEPNPDLGLMILYELAERGDYPSANYDLGHWSATDLAEWKPGTDDVAALRYDLPTAVKYLRRVADNMPKAALELGKLYSDLGVTDSARHYIGLALTQAKGNLYNEALFNMGLLEESQGDSVNSFMKEAQNSGYEPAIEHKTILEKDHRAAIELMRSTGHYKGPRTIPPIVFEYLKAKEIRDFTGLADSALKVLQEQSPDCHFNRTFITAMDAAIGTSRMKKDIDSAWVLLRKSSEEGCLYARMMCSYQDAINELASGSKSINIEQLNDILPTIPFAGVLLSDLLIRTGHYGEAIKAAQYPIAKSNPAAAYILSSIPSSYDITTDNKSFSGINDIHKVLLKSYIIQKIVRLSPHKNRWLMECFTNDAIKRSLFREKPDESQVSLLWQKMNKHTSAKPIPDNYFANNEEGARLWLDAISASDNIKAKLNAVFWAIRESKDSLHREKLVRSALNDLQREKNDSEELWQMWLWCLGFCSSDLQLALRNEGDAAFKQRYDQWVELMMKGKPSLPKMFPDIETVQMRKQISIYALLDELTSHISEFRQHIRKDGKP